jgi:hypothetical protein
MDKNDDNSEDELDTKKNKNKKLSVGILRV